MIIEAEKSKPLKITAQMKRKVQVELETAFKGIPAVVKQMELQVGEGYLQWRVPNGEWQNLLEINELKKAAESVYITEAKIEADGSLLITLSNGEIINAGYIVSALSEEQEQQLAQAAKHIVNDKQLEAIEPLSNSEIETLINSFV